MSAAVERDLFGDPVHPPDPPIARNADPWTSHAAAREFLESGRRDSQHKRIVRAMLRKDALTAEEIGRAAGVNRCGRRMPELERRGLVEVDGVRECGVTGTRARTWRLA